MRHETIALAVALAAIAIFYFGFLIMALWIWFGTAERRERREMGRGPRHTIRAVRPR